MVELQETIPRLETAGIAAYAISYDPVDVLAQFAEAKGVTFPLLSDVGSAVIERVGLLNPHVRRQHEETNEVHEKRFEGVPYPAAYLLDESGVVVGRRTHDDYRIRESAAAILSGHFGFQHPAMKGPSFADNVVAIRVSPETSRFSPYQLVWIEFSIQIEPGWHIYANPAPSGLRSLSIGIDAEKYLKPGEAVVDQSPEFRAVAGVDHPVDTFEGCVRGRLPVVLATSRGLPVDVTGFVDYQVCSTTECLPPARFKWSVRLQPRVV